MAPEEVKDSEVKAESKPAVQEKTTAPAQPAIEKQTNCLACNKPLRKLKRYYRDGKFYCSKKCWRDYLKKSAK